MNKAWLILFLLLLAGISSLGVDSSQNQLAELRQPVYTEIPEEAGNGGAGGEEPGGISCVSCSPPPSGCSYTGGTCQTCGTLSCPAPQELGVTSEFIAWLDQFYPGVSPYNRALRELYTLSTGRGAGLGDPRNNAWAAPVYGPLPGETAFSQAITRPLSGSIPREEIAGSGAVTSEFVAWLDQFYPGASPYNRALRELYTLHTGRGAGLGDARNNPGAAPVYGPLPGEAAFNLTITLPLSGSIPKDEIPHSAVEEKPTFISTIQSLAQRGFSALASRIKSFFFGR